VPLQLIGSSIVPSSLVTGIRVSSSPRVFRSRRPRRFGLPLVCFLRLVRRRTPRVAPRRTPFSCAGDRSASCLASPILRDAGGDFPGCPASSLACLASGVSARLPRLPHLPAVPAMDHASHPASSILRRCWRPIPRVAPLPRSSSLASSASSGLPRLPRLPAVPAMDRAGCPAPPCLPRCRRGFHGSPRFLAPSASLPMPPPGCPGVRISGLCRRSIFGLPRISSLGVAILASPGCPGSCTYGWVDDESPAGDELCILGLRRG